MKPTTPDRIRNVALISHGGAGKTSLAEAMLFDAGAIQRLGSVDAGTATLDHDPDEQKRKQSINLAIGTLEARWLADHARRHARLRRLPGRRDRGAGRGRCRDRGGRCLAPASRSAPRRSGAWPTSASCRASCSSTRWTARTPTTMRCSTSSRHASARRSRRSTCRSAPPSRSAGYVDVIEQHANVYEGGKPKEVPIPDELRAGEEHAPRGAGRGRGRGVRRADDEVPRGRGDQRRRDRGGRCTRARARAAWSPSSSAAR